MDPKYLVGANFMGMALAMSGLLRDDGLTPEQRALRREEAEKRRLEEIAAQRAQSPHVAAAEAKRARKAERLRKLALKDRKP